MSHAAARTLSAHEIDAFGAELDALRDEVVADLGQSDLDHIRGVIRASRYAEATGRILLHVGIDPVSFVVGTGALALGKILENMEVGHNVMHGQYDWTGDPHLQGQSYEWDIVCTGDNWRHYHNVEHHTFTNILGKDRDIGYGFLRVTDDQPWHPRHLAQPVVAVSLAANFQWGVAIHDIHRPDEPGRYGSLREQAEAWTPFLRKAGWQVTKDYVVFPVLAGWNAPRVFVGNALANLTRNVWSFSVIFCGHFPDGVAFYAEDDVTDETRGGWYLRQLRGSVNFEGSRWLHLLSGHLSHQIEHHLFPDLPAHRYPAMGERVREICARYGQPYNTGSLGEQLGSVARNLLRLSLPGRRASAEAAPAVSPPMAAAA